MELLVSVTYMTLFSKSTFVQWVSKVFMLLRREVAPLFLRPSLGSLKQSQLNWTLPRVAFSPNYLLFVSLMVGIESRMLLRQRWANAASADLAFRRGLLTEGLTVLVLNCLCHSNGQLKWAYAKFFLSQISRLHEPPHLMLMSINMNIRLGSVGL